MNVVLGDLNASFPDFAGQPLSWTKVKDGQEKIYTNELVHYENLPDYVREFINHTESYVRGAIHTNGLENFWSLLKRSLGGTYVSVEPFHLEAYVNEQAFRYNHRKLTDAERFTTVMKQIVGRRVTYNELTGKTEEAYS